MSAFTRDVHADEHALDIQLQSCQTKAIANIRAQASILRPSALVTLSEIFRMSNLPEASIDLALSSIRQYARVAFHFHPDRPIGSRTVVSALLEDGLYRSQFETGISNGSVSAYAGGARDEWERSLFAGAYHEDDCFLPEHRPKYGALDLTRQPDGPSPRFGSCYFVLKAEVSTRSTFTFGGSQADPKFRGTSDHFEALLAAVFEECFTRDFALGVSGIRPPQLLEHILQLENPYGDPAHARLSRNLDHFVEAQVHGEVRLDRDVEALVADPSFQPGETGRNLEALGSRYGFPVHWHSGSRVRATDIPADFRGPTMPSLASRIARDDLIDAEVVGAAVQDLSRDPEKWANRGAYAEVLQELKLLWHVLLRFGKE